MRSFHVTWSGRLALCVHIWSSTSRSCSVPLLNKKALEFPALAIERAELHLCNHHHQQHLSTDPETITLHRNQSQNSRQFILVKRHQRGASSRALDTISKGLRSLSAAFREISEDWRLIGTEHLCVLINDRLNNCYDR